MSDAELPFAPRRRAVALLLLGTFALALYVWLYSEGYNLADTVETVLNADRIVRHGELSGGTRVVRPTLLPLLYTPFIYVDKWLTGLADQRIAFPLARGFQALLSVAFVWVSVRLATRLAGPRCGLAAGVLVAVNPIFLRYAVDPIPGLAAGALFGLGLERLLMQLPEQRTLWRSLVAGLCVGVAISFAYKLIPLGGALFLVMVARDRWKHRAAWLGLGTGILVGLTIGCAADGQFYGDFGLSLSNYVVYNVFVTAYPILSKLGLDDAAAGLARAAADYYGSETQVDPANLQVRIAHHTKMTWYVTYAFEFLVWPALLFVSIGVVRSLRRPKWPTTMLLFSTVLFAAVLSAKHSKSYRLLLPALPLIASMGGLGWTILAGPHRRSVRWYGAMILLLVAGGLGVRQFHTAGPRSYGAYPQAVAWVNQRLSDESTAGRSAASEPYNMIFRTSARQRQAHLFAPLKAWPAREVPLGSEPTRVREWDRLMWVYAYGVVLEQRAGLRSAIDSAFELDAAFYDRNHHMRAQGPLYVFRNRTRGGGAERLFRRPPDLTPIECRQARQFGEPIQFEWKGASPPQTLNLLGSEMFEVPGSGLVAIRLYWTVPTQLASEFDVLLGITTNDGTEVVRGRLPASFSPVGAVDWQPGQVMVDTRLLGIKAEGLRRRGGLRQVKLSVDASRQRIEQPEWAVLVTDDIRTAELEPENEAVIEPRWVGKDSPF